MMALSNRWTPGRGSGFSSGVIWKQHRRRYGPCYTSLFGFSPESCQMIQCQPTLWHGGRTGRGFRPRALAEDHQVEKRVAHETVAAMQPAGGFAGDKKVFDPRFAVDVDLDPAVLVMQRWIDQHRILCNI